MDLRKLVQQLDHPIVVFQSMQSDPGQAVFTRNEVLVKGLMLVPQNNHAKDRHREGSPKVP
jgi:hypothetical protein